MIDFFCGFGKTDRRQKWRDLQSAKCHVQEVCNGSLQRGYSVSLQEMLSIFTCKDLNLPICQYRISTFSLSFRFCLLVESQKYSFCESCYFEKSLRANQLQTKILFKKRLVPNRNLKIVYGVTVTGWSVPLDSIPSCNLR